MTQKLKTQSVTIPQGVNDATLRFGPREVALTNLNKLFWPDLRITKRDLLQYYADVAHVLLPHVKDRAMVMKRYPNGAEGDFFYMKRAPDPRPEWIEICTIDHGGAGIINFPIVQDLVERSTRNRVEIEVKIVRPIHVVAARVPLVEIDATEVDHP